MPRPPNIASAISDLSANVFSKFVPKITALSGEVFPLHIGDTWLEPAVKMQDMNSSDNPGLHRYSRPVGHPILIDAISDDRQVTSRRIVVTAGVTGGLHICLQTLLNPGEEVLILTPYWPLIEGIVRINNGNPVLVPFFEEQLLQSSIDDLVSPYITERTVAIYVNSPNNPSGHCLNFTQVRALAEIARAHNLWILSDEVYDRLCFKKHHSIRDVAPERSFSFHSFSKVYGMAGNRCGFIIMPDQDSHLSNLVRSTTYTYYSVGTAAQLAAAAILKDDQGFLQHIQQQYLEMARWTANALDVRVPSGGTFLFINVADVLQGEENSDSLVLECLEKNLILAPGESFGNRYKKHLRVCFTSIEPHRTKQAIEILLEILEQRRQRQS